MDVNLLKKLRTFIYICILLGLGFLSFIYSYEYSDSEADRNIKYILFGTMPNGPAQIINMFIGLIVIFVASMIAFTVFRWYGFIDIFRARKNEIIIHTYILVGALALIMLFILIVTGGACIITALIFNGIWILSWYIFLMRKIKKDMMSEEEAKERFNI